MREKKINYTEGVEFVGRMPQIYKVLPPKKTGNPDFFKSLTPEKRKEMVAKAQETKKKNFKKVSQRVKNGLRAKMKRLNLTIYGLSVLSGVKEKKIESIFRKGDNIKIETYNKLIDFLERDNEKILSSKYNPNVKDIKLSKKDLNGKSIFRNQNKVIRDEMLNINKIDIEEAKEMVKNGKYKTFEEAINKIKHKKKIQYLVYKENKEWLKI